MEGRPQVAAQKGSGHLCHIMNDQPTKALHEATVPFGKGTFKANFDTFTPRTSPFLKEFLQKHFN
jgi:hypothetical protein